MERHDSAGGIIVTDHFGTRRDTERGLLSGSSKLPFNPVNEIADRPEDAVAIKPDGPGRCFTGEQSMLTTALVPEKLRRPEPVSAPAARRDPSLYAGCNAGRSFGGYFSPTFH